MFGELVAFFVGLEANRLFKPLLISRSPSSLFFPLHVREGDNPDTNRLIKITHAT